MEKYRWFRRLSRIATAGLLTVTAVLLAYSLANVALMAVDQRRAPYSSDLKTLAWQLDWHERAYNFSPVTPGQLYRSGEPDNRFLDYVHQRYGIQRLISLNGRGGPRKLHEQARKLGLETHIFDWTSRAVPPRDELDHVLALFSLPGPALVHCAAGKDRTGFAIAAYRLKQGWTLEKAFAEMEQRWHRPGKRPWFQNWLREHASAFVTP